MKKHGCESHVALQGRFALEVLFPVEGMWAYSILDTSLPPGRQEVASGTRDHGWGAVADGLTALHRAVNGESLHEKADVLEEVRTVSPRLDGVVQHGGSDLEVRDRPDETGQDSVTDGYDFCPY